MKPGAALNKHVDAFPVTITHNLTYYRWLIIGLICLNMLVVLLASVLLVENRRTHEESAQVAVSNISSLLEKEIVGTYEKADLALQSVADEFSEFNGSDRSKIIDWNLRLTHIRDSLPLLGGLRATNPSGDVIYGLANNDSKNANISDIDYFIKLRENSDLGLVISSPLQGRVTGQLAIPLARRLKYKDGSFGGVVVATIPLDNFSVMFSSLKLYSKGTAGFRDSQLRLITRYPAATKGDGATGATKISDDFKKALKENPNIGSYNSVNSAIDGVSRFYHYRRNAVHGFYVIVGFAHDDILAPWHKLVWQTTALVGFFMFGSLIFGWQMRRFMIQQQAMTELMEQSEHRYRNIVETQTNFVERFLPGGVLTFANEALAKFLGVNAEEMLGKSFYPYLHEEDREETIRQIESINTKNRIVVNECRVVLPGGEVRWNRWTNSGIFDDNGLLVEYQSVGQDITERKQAEEEKQILEQQLQHAQKLESLGVLSGGIAHDFNNILAVIMGYCSLTKLNYETAKKNIPIIEDAAERASGLCRQMMAYAGKAQLTKTKINIVDKVDQIVSMLQATLSLNAVIKTNLSAEIPLIEGDASQLGQVVMNLIINASEAIGTEQGKVDVSLTSIKVKTGKAYEDYHGKPIPIGEYVCLEVTDNGCGMDEATKWRIFEPFYTTKFTGRGLGMSAVLGIIKSHAGALQLFSEPGQGTTFKVYLPAPANEVNGEENQIESAPPALWQGSGTILLVEDEDQIRDIAKEMLGIFGFSVLEAANGKEALEIYLQKGTEISLVLSDMGMPIMDGYELFHKLKSIDPELPIVVSSGYGDVEVSARIGSDNIAGIISKPYNPDQLREVLKSVVKDFPRS